MKKILTLLILLCIEKSLHAQVPHTPYIYTIKADSVKITNTCDTAELIIENHTQTVPGFLFNKGRGRTEFRRMAQLNDTTVVIGGDSIHLGRGNKNFANADLTFTGNRNHNGALQYLNLYDFGGIYMSTKSYLGWPEATLTLDTLEGFKFTMIDKTTPLPITSALNITHDMFRFNLAEPNETKGNSSFVMFPNKLAYNVYTDFSGSSLNVENSNFSLGTFIGENNCGINGGIPHDGGIEMDMYIRNGLMALKSDNSENGETFIVKFYKADSIVMSHEGNTRFVQDKDKFLFRNIHTGNYLDFRLLGLPASTSTTDSMLIIDNNGQVKKKPQISTRKSATVSASTYTVPADVDVVFVNYTGGTATISLPSGTLDREITIKNLNTTNSVALSGLDASEPNTVATRGAITIKYTGSAWVGISKY